MRTGVTASTTVIPTDLRITTLVHDPVHRETCRRCMLQLQISAVFLETTLTSGSMGAFDLGSAQNQ